MLRTHHHFFRLLFQLTDGITVILAWLMAYWVRFVIQPSWLPAPEAQILSSEYVVVAFGLVLLWFLSLQINGAYKSWRASRLGLELLNVLKASGLAFVVFVAIQHFVAREDLSRATLGLFFVNVSFGLVLTRILLRSTLQQMRAKGWNQRHLVMIGDGRLSEGVERRLRLRPELGFHCSGWVRVSGESSGLKCLGEIKDLAKIMAQAQPDVIIIALRNQEGALLDQLLHALGEYNVSVRIVPDVTHYAVLGFEVEEFEGLPVIAINESPLHGWNRILKRLSDIVYALTALLVFAVPMAVITLLIKLGSRGPVLYSQERMGLDGRIFKMWKFRSMRIDAESKSGAVWAKENDPRVTWIGAILRKTSLDELPQLFNVLMGEMSCVGPRPERPVFVQQFKSQIPGYMLRHKVKAGMTGWAQINGFRGNTSLEGRIQFDLYYISNWSVGFDLKIMFMTVFKGFISPHAY